jgi:pantoate--beta-alanine ligase
MIETITALESLRSRIRGWKRDGLRVGFVPTMGNLHAGHYSLVALARQHADKVVSSVFVNPTQFGPNEDFTRYPRTPDADTSGLQPPAATCCGYRTWRRCIRSAPTWRPACTSPASARCWKARIGPGHFDGVCTVVSRLFNQVQPDVAVFGKKDYQQLAVIRQMVADLHSRSRSSAATSSAKRTAWP